MFYTEEQITSDQANFTGSYPYLIEENYVHHTNPQVVTSATRGKTMEVNTLAPNKFGLYHMQGNVAEWCFDYYGTYTSTATPNQDPVGPHTGSLRVNRGGSWNDFAKHLRSAYRSVANPQTYEQTIGLRLARNATAETTAVEISAANAASAVVSLPQHIETTYSLEQIKMPAKPKILVVYYSYSGNTQNAAELMAQELGVPLLAIEMQHPYRGNIYEVSQKDLNSNARPALKLSSQANNLKQYDVILLGYPTWWGTMPMPVFAFLEQYDLSGKIILPFSSHGSTLFGDSLSDLAKAEPQAYVGQGFEFFYSGGRNLKQDLLQWLKDSGIDTSELKPW